MTGIPWIVCLTLRLDDGIPFMNKCEKMLRIQGDYDGDNIEFQFILTHFIEK